MLLLILILILILIFILILPNNTNATTIIAQQVMIKMLNEKGDLKMSNNLESLTSNGNALQSFVAAQVNDLSPSVALDINASLLKQEGVIRTPQVIA